MVHHLLGAAQGRQELRQIGLLHRPLPLPGDLHHAHQGRHAKGRWQGHPPLHYTQMEQAVGTWREYYIPIDFFLVIVLFQFTTIYTNTQETTDNKHSMNLF